MSKVAIEQSLREPGKLCVAIAFVSLILFLVYRIEFLAILTSILFSTTFAIGIVAKRSLRKAKVGVQLIDSEIRNGEPTAAKVSLNNESRWLPLIDPVLEIKESGRGRIERFRIASTIGNRRHRSDTAWVTIQNRGLQQIEVKSIATTFPFGFFSSKRTDIDVATEPAIVWPALRSITLPELPNTEKGVSRFDPSRRDSAVELTERALIREYRDGDSRRLINWRLSAKLDQLLVVDPNSNRKQSHTLVLSTRASLWLPLPYFERMIALVAALATELAKRRSLRGIHLNQAFYPINNYNQLKKFLDALSISYPSDEAAPIKEVDRSGRALWILPSLQGGIQLAPQEAIADEELLHVRQ